MMIPDFTDLKTWAHSLVIDFPKDNIPTLTDENHWKLWGDNVSQCTSFIKNNAPGTRNYSDWKKWAQRIFFCMNNS